MSKDIIELKRFSQNAADFADKIEKSFDFNLPRDGDPASSTGVWNEEIKAFADSQTLKSLFFSEDWVYIVVDLTANKLSSVPLVVVRKEVNSDGTITTEPVNDHGLMPLIAMPNPWQEYPSWMYNYAVEDTLLGNCINWFAERNGHLVILPADQVTAQFDNKGQLDTYKLHVRTTEQSFLSGQQTSDQALSFPADQIIHTRRPNPASLLWGLSPFTPGRKPILFNRYSSDYLNSFYLKQATPAMAITMDRTVNEELALRQLASFEMAYTGRRNARRTLMLPKGTDAKPLTHTLAEQSLVDMIEKNREVIINLLKVPKHELGLQESGSLGSEEHKIALRNFWEATLIPMSKRIQGSLTQFFRRKDMLTEDEFFEFDLTDVDALKDDLKKKAEIAKEMAQTLPLNTVIQKVWEEEPLNDPRAELPLSLTPKAGVSVNADSQQDREEDTSAGDNEATEEEKRIRADRSFAVDYFERHPERMEGIKKGLNDILDKQGSQIEGRTLDLFIDMAEKAIKVIKDTLVDTDSNDVGTTKAVSKNGVGRFKAKIPDEEEFRRSLENEFDDLEEQYVDEYSDILRPAVELSYDNFIEFGFGLEDKTRIEVLKARDGQKRKAILTSRGLDAFFNVSKTRSERIINEVRKGVEAKESIGDITKRIADTFRDPEANISRARTIARTEALTASSIGQHAAFLNADEVIPGIEKAWVNINDLRVRGNPDGLYPDAKDDHWKLQGQRRKKGKKFTNGLEYPRDVRSDDPAKVINCRCSLVLIPPGETVGEV